MCRTFFVKIFLWLAGGNIRKNLNNTILALVYGQVFLFIWLPGDHNNQGSVAKVARQTEVLFAKQVCYVVMVARCVSHDLTNSLTTHFLFQRYVICTLFTKVSRPKLEIYYKLMSWNCVGMGCMVTS